MQDAAVPVAAVFAAVEAVFVVSLSLVAYRIGRGKHYARCRPSFAILGLTCVCTIALGVWAMVEEDYPAGVVALCQAMSDVSSFVLLRRASSCRYARGSVSAWRSVVSSMISLCAALFVTGAIEFQVLFVVLALERLAWLSATFIELRRYRDQAFLDEWGLLLMRWPSDLSALLISSEDDEGEGFDVENPLERSRGEGEVVESFILGGALPYNLIQNGSTDSADSTDSFSLVRPPSSSPSLNQPISRPGDDAGGHRPSRSELILQRLPITLEVLAHREIRTTGDVPLVVYVLKTDRNGVIVHRYGEFRGLCNRVISRFYHDMGAEMPPFPGRRVFRKFIPQAMGGVAHGAAGDREFIANRARGLGIWLQQVLEFVRDHPENEAVLFALLDFLKPIVHYSPDSDLEQVIGSAVLIFSDTVLNPIAPPSPCL